MAIVSVLLVLGLIVLATVKSGKVTMDDWLRGFLGAIAVVVAVILVVIAFASLAKL